MNVLGLHLLLELKECNPSLLDDLAPDMAGSEAVDAGQADIQQHQSWVFFVDGLQSLLATADLFHRESCLFQDEPLQTPRPRVVFDYQN